MKRVYRFWLLVSLVSLVAIGCSSQPRDESATVELVNVSYDPTRELYAEINQAFAAEIKAKQGIAVSVKQSHGGSGAQARAVIDGLEADVVTLALANDIDAIAAKGLIAADWQSRLPDNSTPYASTIVLLVRKGNPSGIKDWPDLGRPGVKVITPNPKTGGGARWNFLAAWGFVAVHRKGSDADAEDLVRRIYLNVAKLDSGARGSTETFTRRGIGDVFISWENEAILIQKEFPGQYEIVYPSASILAEPPVAIVDRVAEKRKTTKLATEYLSFLYTAPAQKIIGKHGYRPRDPDKLKEYAPSLPPITLFTLRDIASDWASAQQRFFADGGIFDRIYQLKK